MQRHTITLAALLLLLAACTNSTPPAVPDATAAQLAHVEPLSWWTGMKCPLQLLVNGDGISSYDVSIAGGRGVKVEAVHKAESPNYLFVDISVSPNAEPGTYWLVFDNGSESFRYAYEIAAREDGSAQRPSFTTADLVYLIMPNRFANGDPTNDDTPDTAEKADRSREGGRHGGDIQGIIDHLDYIADLGATAIWCTPLLLDDDSRGSYHGYACADYYKIDPRFGDNELYREFVDQAHQRGIPQILYGDEMMFTSSDLRQGHGGLRVDFPGGWEGDEFDLFTEEGRLAADTDFDGSAIEKGMRQDVYDYCRTLFRWRKDADVIHNGRTLHFLPEGSGYGYFRYDDDEAVFVFINVSSENETKVPWSNYAEFTGGLGEGVNVITGEPAVVSDATVVPPLGTLVIEYKR